MSNGPRGVMRSDWTPLTSRSTGPREPSSPSSVRRTPSISPSRPSHSLPEAMAPAQTAKSGSAMPAQPAAPTPSRT